MPVGKYSSNYSKWDQLELSDDSDIEGHPNVDKKSLIGWKQRDIHEKREQRKIRIARHEANIALNNVLLPRFADILRDLSSGGTAYYSQLVERLKTQPSPDAPTKLPGQPTYDHMIELLLLKTWDEVKAKGVGKDDPGLGEALLKQLTGHVEELKVQTKEMEGELEKERKEQAKHITSDDLHEGFDAGHVTASKPAPPPALKGKSKGKEKEKVIEVLNPKTSDKPKADDSDDSDDPDNEIPTLTPSLKAFSQLPLKSYEQSWEFLKRDNGVFVPGAVDALFIAGFEAEMRGESKYARQCIHQGTIVQFCEKLGKDGVSLFFKKALSGDPRAEQVFLKDYEDTYTAMAKRAAKAVADDNSAGREQIQLVAENENTTITFNVPDGPPPETITLEGPGTEDLDPVEVRKGLQLRWDIFEGFEEDFKEALKSGELEKVNEVLGAMEVPDAERVVELLSVAGIMSFAEGGVRDATGGEVA